MRTASEHQPGFLRHERVLAVLVWSSTVAIGL